MADNMKKMLADQQKINEAVKYIMTYFGEENCYCNHIEQMLDAQTQIIGLMELAKEKVLTDPSQEFECSTDKITWFLYDVRQYLKMLEPFANLLGQTGYGKPIETD